VTCHPFSAFYRAQAAEMRKQASTFETEKLRSLLLRNAEAYDLPPRWAKYRREQRRGSPEPKY
jgi:hypothetical protein